MPEGQISTPADPPKVPGFPESFHPITVERFDTLDTKPPRPAIGDGSMSWCDGWMPVGPSNLRTLYGTGQILYSAPAGTSVVWFGFGNIATTPYMTVLLTDGSIQWVVTNTGQNAQLAAPGTIQNPSTILGASQWGSQYLIFAKDQTNGYWLWDSTNLYTAGTVAPDITLTSPGTGYSSQPTITYLTTGNGTGAVFSATLTNSEITQVNVVDPGTGFGENDLIALYFQDGGSDYSCVALPQLSGPTVGGVGEIIVLNSGSGYSSATVVNALNPDGSISDASFAPVIQDGAITSVAVVWPSGGFSAAPEIVVTDPGYHSAGITGGSGAQLVATLACGQVTSMEILGNGSGYVSPPTVQIVGDGTNAQVAALIENGQVTSFQLINPGSGYSYALAIITGGNNAASATAHIMPFGISGTTVEVYESIVWVANGAAASNTPPKNRVLFSSANSPSDFSTTGGAFASTDSFLRVGYHWLKQTNGFLYLGGDSSINYISGVQTSASTGTTSIASTTFSNLNVDPQLGSPWPSSVQVFSRNIVFANTVGVFVSYGGAVTKASLQLDGFYQSGPIFGSNANFSSAVATVFGIPVYMLLLPVVDQFTQQLVNKLLIWDGKRWFTSQQDRNLTYIAAQEINSVLTAWGTDGTNIFPLFQNPTTGFSKVVQSKLFAEPAYYTTKTGVRLHGVVQVNISDSPIIVSIDNEKSLGSGNAEYTVQMAGSGISWTNNVGQPISWTNNSNEPIEWGGPGLLVFGPEPVGQNGRLLGLTAQTTASDLALLSLGLSEQIYSTNV